MKSRNNSKSSHKSSHKLKFVSSSKNDTKTNNNPFDKFANSKKKHEVLNRRVKGEDRDVGRAKRKAVEDRKERLLNQFKRANKSNSFTDKRFGEQDADLSIEDKMYLRLQKEKVRSSRNLSMYNLDSVTPAETLTHKGQVLGVSNINDESNFSDSEDDNDKALGKDIVNKLHFGGGLVEKTSANNHYDALQEIISKSKVQKQMKKEAKDEQDFERERLDTAFRELVSEAAVEFRPTRGDGYKREGNDNKTDDVDEYDQFLHTMTFEAKIKATDRTKTPEEIALEEKKKLEELEEARLARMKAINKVEDSMAASHNLTNRPHTPHRTDDEVDMVYNNNVKSKKQQYAVAGSANGNVDDNFDIEDEHEDDEEGDEEDDEDEEVEDDDAESADYEIDDYGDDDDDDGDNAVNSSDVNEDVVLNNDSDVTDESIEEIEEQATELSKEAFRKKIATSNSAPEVDKKDLMPHQISCPADINEFDNLIQEYTSSLDDIKLLIDRILIWNSVLLPGEEGVNNRVLMHNFMDVLLKYFTRIGDSLGKGGNDVELKSLLDYLTAKIFKLSQDISDVIPSLWGRWIKLFESQLQKRLRDYSLRTTSITWPSLGRLLLCNLVGHIFSLSDYKHAIYDSITLFLCQLLVQCPVSSIQDLVSGMLVVNMLLDYMNAIKDAKIRYIPEVISFLSSALALYQSNHLYHTTSVSTVMSKDIMKTFDLKLSSLLHSIYENKDLINEKYEEKYKSIKISWKLFHRTKSNSFSSNESIETSVSILSALYCVINEFAIKYESFSSFPDIFRTILAQLKDIDALQTHRADQASIDSNVVSRLPDKICVKHVNLLNRILSVSSQRISTREPLQWRMKKNISIEAKTPRFDVNYKMKKDLDDDQEKVLLKQLKRQYVREKKAATRELRRDNEFLDQVRFQDKLDKRKSLQEERWKNFSWMEEQQAVLNTFVKKFKGELKGGGTNGIKPSKSRRKRK